MTVIGAQVPETYTQPVSFSRSKDQAHPLQCLRPYRLATGWSH